MIKYLYVDIKLFGDDDNANNNVNDSTKNNDEYLSAINDIFGIEDGEFEEYAKRINGEENYSDDINNEPEHQQNDDDEAESQENNIETTADDNLQKKIILTIKKIIPMIKQNYKKILRLCMRKLRLN